MNLTNSNGMPTANIAINKSRIKCYGKNSTPTYYLQKGQEFQLELFNPTNSNILAVISLNGNKISQGGLVLRPGERVFLDRYLDVPKKFKFETYEVSNTDEVRKAIEDNGDLKVEFYREQVIIPNLSYSANIWFVTTLDTNPFNYDGHPIIISTTDGECSNISTTINSPNTAYNSILSTSSNLGFYNNDISTNKTSYSKIIKRKIETGRVEEGSYSAQEMKTVHKNWGILPFWTVSAKLLPISQKINTVNDIQIKRYCTACGSKLHKKDKYCSNCGNRA